MFQLDEFLRASREVELPNGITITMRVLSDLEMNARRDYAMSEAMRVSDELKNSDTEAYKTKILPFKDSSRESILNLLSEGRVAELRREVETLYPINFVPSPDDATLSDEIDTEKRQSEHEAQVYKDRLEYIVKGIDAFRKKMDELSPDVLFGEVKARAIQVYPYVASQDAEFYYTIWCSVEKDGKKYWKNVDSVRKLPKIVIDKLGDLYKELDSQNPWELTKSVSEG